MNGALVGGLLGGVAVAGLLIAVLATPPLRRRTLSDRIEPYLADAPAPSRLLGETHKTGPGVVGRLLAPVMKDATRLVDRLVGGQASVRRRLSAIRSPMSIEQFRVEQVIWGAIAGLAGLGVGLVSVLAGSGNPLLAFILLVVCLIGGVLGRDWWLSRAASRRESDILAEFPVVAEMLALAVTAGEGPLGAIDRITRLAHGHLIDILSGLLAETRSGTPLLTALSELRDHTTIEPLARFLDGMAVAIDRGTPLAEVLRAQAADVRELGKRELLESGGRKEIAMMVPVVFLVLPMTILFALFPGLVAITAVAS